VSVQELLQDKIEELKAEGKRLFEVQFEDGKTCVLAYPTRKQFKLIMSKGKNGPVIMVDALVKNCYVGGEVTQAEFFDEINTDYMAQLSASIDEILNFQKVAIKKL
jgi:hypothetical protein